MADGDLAFRERAAAPAEPPGQRECAGERRRLDWADSAHGLPPRLRNCVLYADGAYASIMRPIRARRQSCSRAPVFTVSHGRDARRYHPIPPGPRRRRSDLGQNPRRLHRNRPHLRSARHRVSRQPPRRDRRPLRPGPRDRGSAGAGLGSRRGDDHRRLPRAGGARHGGPRRGPAPASPPPRSRSRRARRRQGGLRPEADVHERRRRGPHGGGGAAGGPPPAGVRELRLLSARGQGEVPHRRGRHRGAADDPHQEQPGAERDGVGGPGADPRVAPGPRPDRGRPPSFSTTATTSSPSPGSSWGRPRRSTPGSAIPPPRTASCSTPRQWSRSVSPGTATATSRSSTRRSSTSSPGTTRRTTGWRSPAPEGSSGSTAGTDSSARTSFPSRLFRDGVLTDYRDVETGWETSFVYSNPALHRGAARRPPAAALRRGRARDPALRVRGRGVRAGRVRGPALSGNFRLPRGPSGRRAPRPARLTPDTPAVILSPMSGPGRGSGRLPHRCSVSHNRRK